MENTRAFARGLPANNALLWGARGMGKSSLVKAAHAADQREPQIAGRLKLIEIHREDIESLPALMTRAARRDPQRFLVFCDDLSFDAATPSYKSLKAALEGGIEGRPGQRAVLRHLQPPPSDAARHDGERALDARSIPARRSRRKCRCPTASASGSASTTAARTNICAMVARLRRAFRPRRAPGSDRSATRSNGRRRAAPAPGASPGNSSRISPGGSESRSTPAADQTPTPSGQCANPNPCQLLARGAHCHFERRQRLNQVVGRPLTLRPFILLAAVVGGRVKPGHDDRGRRRTSDQGQASRKQAHFFANYRTT